jgi:divalent metal cation (Fe/Co/Zn/Cd) transporter
MATVGNIVFSFLMMSVSLILIVESIRALASHSDEGSNDTTEFHVPAIVAVSVAFFVKFCLFWYCWGLREYPNVFVHVTGLIAGSYFMGGS